MNSDVGRPFVGRWYTRWDRGEIFQVIGIDPDFGTVLVQSFDGTVDVIDSDAWDGLPLGQTQPPGGWLLPTDQGTRPVLRADKAALEWVEPPLG